MSWTCGCWTRLPLSRSLRVGHVTRRPGVFVSLRSDVLPQPGPGFAVAKKKPTAHSAPGLALPGHDPLLGLP